MKIACIISIFVLAVFSSVAGESASIEADITAVANAVDKDEKPHVIQFLRSPGTNSTTGSFVARNALNRQYANTKIQMPLARCWKRLAVDRSIKRDFRVYGFNQLLGLAEREKSVIPIAKTAAEDISRGDSGTLKQKADAFLQNK